MIKWEVVTVGNSGLKLADGNYSSKYPRQEEFLSKGVPFIRANNFSNKTIIDKELKFISEEKHKQLKKGHLKERDILIMTRGNIGEVALVPSRHQNSNINAQIVLLRSNGKWHPEYLLHLLTSFYVKKQLPTLITGSALKQLSVTNLKRLNLVQPPIETQRKIAAILDEADKLRRLNKKLIKKYEQLSQSLFLEMFGDPISNPRGWEKLSTEHFTLKVNKLSSKAEGDEIEYVDISSINNKNQQIENTSKYPFQKRPSRAQQILKPGDVLLSTVRPNLKNIALIQKADLIGSTGFYVFRVNENLNNLFLFEMLKTESVTNSLVEITSGANYPALKSKDIQGFSFIIPPIAQQEIFAQSLKEIERQKLQAQKSFEYSEELFNSLLQRAFRGELI